MADIQSLTEEVQRLSQSVDSWNSWIIIGMISAALSAALLVIVQFMAFRESETLAKVQNELIKAKDEMLAKDLRDKDVVIAQLNLEIERLRAPRTLTAEQQFRITDKLKAFQGTTFEIVTYPHVPEPSGFSNLIAETLSHAGWIIQKVDTHKFLLGLATGVVVNVDKRGGHHAEEAGKALLESLIDEGVSAKFGRADLVTMIKIQVGQKP
jgi:hypothetical protein